MKNILKKELKLDEISNFELEQLKSFNQLTEQQQFDFVKKWLNKKSIEKIGEPIYFDIDDNDDDIELIKLKNEYFARKKEIYDLPKNVEKKNDLFNLEVWYKDEKARIINKKMKV